jgi:RNA recognition motif-containing protein
MSRYGTVESCRLYTKNAWQQAFVLFKEEDSANKFYDQWGIIYLKHFLKVHPLKLPTEDWNKRSKFTLKLTGLPSGTTIVDLLDIFDATSAKTIVIPKGIRAYQPRPYAYIAFASEEDMNAALTTSFSLVNSDLTWCTLKHKCCQICGSPSHDAKSCPKNKDKSNKKYTTIYNRYKPANYKKLLPRQKTQLNKSSPAAKVFNSTVKSGTSYHR